ncbi:alkaline phosphatase [Enterobacter asburiae]|uniref:alkaline phosphatase n=1 Tax=Enterobacter asburiae TaxID=61645 RepID=UPI0021C74FBB|nr:alkaline phosphatase [Enterobacter asburiae]MCU3140995.1 alkaline phosphatase [Enterobacter asburiae]
MALDAAILKLLTQGAASDAWRFIIERTLDIASRPLAEGNAPSEVVKRDREIGELDLFLASSGWDLWRCFGQPEVSGVERTSDRLARWWAEPSYGNSAARAVLVLDALSLRELPWLLQGAKERGFTLQGVTVTASELPGETDKFARALGLGSRSQLQANGGGLAHRLQPAQTETIDLPWKDCEGLVGSASGAKNWVFWHHWPDAKLHDYGAGQGLELLTKDAAQQLSSDDFWAFVELLATGRRLVITSDHGYAATGYFPDADGEVAVHLKQTFSSGRSKAGNGDAGPFVPPVALQIDSPHGAHLLALGRRKWRSQGGYPTLTHGGLSLLEVLSPFVELTK